MVATHAARLTQDKNFNVHLDGSLVGDNYNSSKAQKKGCCLVGRKALNDISKSAKPSAIQPSKKHNSLNVASTGEDFGVSKKARSFKNSRKSRVGGRKALGGLANSAKPSVENVLKKKSHENKKLLAVEDVDFLPPIDFDDHDHLKYLWPYSYAPCTYYLGPNPHDGSLSLREELHGLKETPGVDSEIEKQPERSNDDETYQNEELDPGYVSLKERMKQFIEKSPDFDITLVEDGVSEADEGLI